MGIYDRDWYVNETLRRMGILRRKAPEVARSRTAYQDGVKMPPQWTRPARNAGRFATRQRRKMSRGTIFMLGVGAGVLFMFAVLLLHRGAPPAW